MNDDGCVENVAYIARPPIIGHPDEVVPSSVARPIGPPCLDGVEK